MCIFKQKMLKKIFKFIVYTILTIIALVLVYLLSERILSRISVNESETSEPKNITMYVMSNGVHTDLVFPTKNEFMDWSTIFPFENTLGKKENFKYIAIGWGDKGFYLNTPEWKDLKVSTAFVAATGIGETALHVTYYNAIHLDETTKSILISEKQYVALIHYIENSIELGSDSKPQLIETSAQYGQNDAFYEAHRSYSIFFTCNSWTNDALKSAGIKASKWVAFDKGILYQHSTN